MDLKALIPPQPWTLLKEAANEWMEDNALRLSAALAYYSIFSIAPLLVIAISIAGWVLGPEAVSGQLQQELAKTVGTEGAGAIQSMVQSASKPSSSIIAGVVGFVTLIIGATGVFGALKDALNTIWEVKAKAGLGIKGFLKDRLLSFGMVLVIGFLLLVSLMLTSALAIVNKTIGDALSVPTFIWGVLTFIISFAVVTALFATIFKMLPDVKVEWRFVWIGAVVTALLFEIGKFLLGWYLGMESTKSSYGAAASVVLLLLWVYYTSLILFFGAEFTQVYARRVGGRVEPADNAEAVTTEARAQEGLAPHPSTAGTPTTAASTGNDIADIPAPNREMPRLILGVEREAPAPKVLPSLFAAIGAGIALGLLSRSREKRSPAALEKIGEGVSELAQRGGESVGEFWQSAGKRGRRVFRRS